MLLRVPMLNAYAFLIRLLCTILCCLFGYFTIVVVVGLGTDRGHSLKHEGER